MTLTMIPSLLQHSDGVVAVVAVAVMDGTEYEERVVMMLPVVPKEDSHIAGGDGGDCGNKNATTELSYSIGYLLIGVVDSFNAICNMQNAILTVRQSFTKNVQLVHPRL